MKAVLFVCTGNQCRSPIAALTFSKFLLGSAGHLPFRVDSAGTWTETGLAVEAYPLQLARALGFDLSAHRTTSVDDLRLEDYDWIVAMAKGHQEALVIEHPGLKARVELLTVLAGVAPSDIPDPVTFDSETAALILLEMQRYVRMFAQRLVREARQP